MASLPRRGRRPGSALHRKLRGRLNRGGIIAYATEYCFGLGCDPRDARAVRRLLRAKGRPQRKGLILIAADLFQLRHHLQPLALSDRERLMESWPGPVTFLLRARGATPRWLKGRHHKVAVRVTAHPDAAALCALLGTALVSTSANRSGRKPLKTYRDCLRVFGASVLVVPGRSGVRGRPSTIVDFESGKVLRK